MIPKPWSYSALDDFVNCPRAYYEKKVARSVKEERGQELIWGEWVHKQFENRQKDGTPLPAELAEFENYMLTLEKLPGAKDTERKIALNRAFDPCEFFAKDVWFRGVIDYSQIWRGKALLIDYKTGKEHQKFKQLKLFALHVFAEYATVTEARCEFYWTKTKSSTGETYTRDMIPQLWAEFIPDLKQYAQAFKQDVWQPRPSGLCNGWCPVKTCEHWKPKRNK